MHPRNLLVAFALLVSAVTACTEGNYCLLGTSCNSCCCGTTNYRFDANPNGYYCNSDCPTNSPTTASPTPPPFVQPNGYSCCCEGPSCPAGDIGSVNGVKMYCPSGNAGFSMSATCYFSSCNVFQDCSTIPSNTNPTWAPTTRSPTLPTRAPTTRSPTLPTRAPTTRSPTMPTRLPTSQAPTPFSANMLTSSPTTTSTGRIVRIASSIVNNCGLSSAVGLVNCCSAAYDVTTNIYGYLQISSIRGSYCEGFNCFALTGIPTRNGITTLEGGGLSIDIQTSGDSIILKLNGCTMTYQVMSGTVLGVSAGGGSGGEIFSIAYTALAVAGGVVAIGAL